jgi:homoserine dehydrogenase
MNVAVIGFTTEARSVINFAERKLIDDVFIKYVITNYNDNSNPIYNLINHKVITNYEKILNDLSVDTVMVLEDNEDSYHYIKYALFAKKNVITSSTYAISKHYVELSKLAVENDVSLYIDGTINFNLPITKLIDKRLLRKVYHFHTITDMKSLDVIGTMIRKKVSLEEAKEYVKIKELDDNTAVNELAILAMLCFDSKIDVSKVYYRGLDGLDLEFLKVIEILGYRLRMQSSAYFNDEEIALVIEPVVHKNNCLVYNMDYLCTQSITIYSDAGAHIFTGKSGTNNRGISVIANINALKDDVKTNFIPKNNYDCLGNENTFTQYIIKATDLNMNIVDKKMGDIYITKPISGAKIKELGEKITFCARIDTQLSN